MAEHIPTCGIDTCGDGLPCDCPCHDDMSEPPKNLVDTGFKLSDFLGWLYDPPSGWRYGFPKIYDPFPGETLEQTLLRDGYPQRELEWGAAKHVRFIGRKVEK